MNKDYPADSREFAQWEFEQSQRERKEQWLGDIRKTIFNMMTPQEFAEMKAKIEEDQRQDELGRKEMERERDEDCGYVRKRDDLRTEGD